MKVALCQITVGDDPEENLRSVNKALEECHGADLAVFPEATQVRFGTVLSHAAESLDGPFVAGLRRAAAAHRTALIAGVFEPADDGRVYNTAVCVDPAGDIIGAYRKIHLFDAFGHAESDRIAAGDTPLVIDVGGVAVGVATCYDLRFPELFRSLVDAGAHMFAVIASWGQGTFKEEHWVTLVRARAIENTMWTIAVDKAPDRSPTASGVMTGVGRSLAVDPMGSVRADLGPFPGTAITTVDQDLTDRVRRLLPSLEHRVLG